MHETPPVLCVRECVGECQSMCGKERKWCESQCMRESINTMYYVLCLTLHAQARMCNTHALTNTQSSPLSSRQIC